MTYLRREEPVNFCNRPKKKIRGASTPATCSLLYTSTYRSRADDRRRYFTTRRSAVRHAVETRVPINRQQQKQRPAHDCWVKAAAFRHAMTTLRTTQLEWCIPEAYGRTGVHGIHALLHTLRYARQRTAPRRVKINSYSNPKLRTTET